MKSSSIKYFLAFGLLSVISAKSFSDGETITVTGIPSSTPDLGLVSSSQSQPAQTGGNNRGMSPEAFAQMRAAQCAAVADILAAANSQSATCLKEANQWQTTQQTYCQGLSSNTSTNTVGGNIKVVNGSTSSTTNSGMTPDVCTTQMNVTYTTKMTSCAATTANILKAAEIQSNAYCKK